jgi:hypothetical protein
VLLSNCLQANQEDWALRDVQITHEQMLALQQGLGQQRKQLVDVSGDGNNCFLYALASPLYGCDPMGGDADSQQRVRMLRQATAYYLAAQAADSTSALATELAVQGGFLVVDSREARAYMRGHISALRGGAPYSMLDLQGELNKLHTAVCCDIECFQAVAVQ